MNDYDEKIDLMLRCHQVEVRNKQYVYADDEQKSKILDQQITDILNPKQDQTLAERTHDALLGSGEGEKDE